MADPNKYSHTVLKCHAEAFLSFYLHTAWAGETFKTLGRGDRAFCTKWLGRHTKFFWAGRRLMTGKFHFLELLHRCQTARNVSSIVLGAFDDPSHAKNGAKFGLSLAPSPIAHVGPLGRESSPTVLSVVGMECWTVKAITIPNNPQQLNHECPLPFQKTACNQTREGNGRGRLQ